MLVNNILQKRLLNLVLLTSCVTIFTAAAFGLGNEYAPFGVTQIFNFAVPLFFLITFPIFAVSILKRVSMLLWTPAVMFLAYTALFKGLGPLVHVLGNEGTLSMIESRVFSHSAHELLGTQLLNLVGTLSILTGLLLCTKKISKVGLAEKIRKSPSRLQFDLKKVAFAMIIVGSIIQFGYVYPYKFGSSGGTLSGTITKLGQLLNLGIALLAYVNARQKEHNLSFLFWTLLTVTVALSFIEFYKSIVVLAILLPAFGAYIGHGNLKKLGIWMVAAGLLYLLASPIVSYGRISILSSTGTINQASFSDRIGIIADYFTGREIADANAHNDRQSAWSRLSYAPQQAYAMREYSVGNTFDSVSNIWIVFVPRIIWPNKPVGIGPGKDFFNYATGKDSNRSSVTVYGDAYWNFGWTGLILIGLLVGAIFGKFSETAYYWLKTEQVVYYPVLFAAIDICMRGLNSWIINGLAGRSVLLIGYIVVILAFSRFLQLKRQSNRSSYSPRKRYSHGSKSH